MARRYYRRRAYNGARRYGGRAKKFYNKQQAVKINIQKEWGAGAFLGMTNHDDKIPLAAEDKLVLATLPIGGKIGGSIVGFFKGVCFGNAVQHKFGIGVNAEAGNTGDDTL